MTVQGSDMEARRLFATISALFLNLYADMTRQDSARERYESIFIPPLLQSVDVAQCPKKQIEPNESRIDGSACAMPQAALSKNGCGTSPSCHSSSVQLLVTSSYSSWSWRICMIASLPFCVMNHRLRDDVVMALTLRPSSRSPEMFFKSEMETLFPVAFDMI